MVEKITTRYVLVFDEKKNESVKRPLLHLRGSMPGDGKWEDDTIAAGTHTCGGPIRALQAGILGKYYECHKCGAWRIGKELPRNYK